MVRIKICGITKLEDALFSVESGAHALGFVFYRKSKRYIDAESAHGIISQLPPFVTTVGVFVNEEKEMIGRIRDISGVDLVQLHGDEDPDFCNDLGMNYIKACRVSDRRKLDDIGYYNTRLILLDNHSEDSYGGTGEVFNWDLVKGFNFRNKRIILSGGLNPFNVKEAIKIIKPDAVDVSSGVESGPGQKDREKIKKFIEAVKNEN